jgi:hypothetical protein
MDFIGLALIIYTGINLQPLTGGGRETDLSGILKFIHLTVPPITLSAPMTDIKDIQ